MRNPIFVIAIILLSAVIFKHNLNGQVVKTNGNICASGVQINKLAPEGTPVLSLADTGFKVKAGAILEVGITTAIVGGSVSIKNKPDIVSVGICLSPVPWPVITDYSFRGQLDSTSFICHLDKLIPSTLYFLRAFAITDKDTLYSSQKAFYTHNEDAIADVDGNYYNTVNIGNQVWLTEDLKTTRFNDGVEISRAEEADQWAWRKTPAWCWYANDSVIYSFPRGKLYNWYAVNTGKLCPDGWHVPSNSEWSTLQNYLGGDSIAGGKLKTTETIFWRNPNHGATNQSGFSAIPGGYRSGTGKFLYSTMFNYWWSSDEFPPDAANFWYVYHARANLYHETSFKFFGYSVRCLKD